MTAPGPNDTVADALARRVPASPGPESGMAAALRELGAVDRAVYEAVARTPTGNLDAPVRLLSDAANHSKLWLAIAAWSPSSAATAAARRPWRGWWPSASPRRRSTWG